MPTLYIHHCSTSQKFFDHGEPEQRVRLAAAFAGRVVECSMLQYGCRVIQKAFDVLPLPNQVQPLCCTVPCRDEGYQVTVLYYQQ
jgi:pumilio-family RNA binding repeat-containing protein